MKISFNVTLNKQVIYSYTSKPTPARLRRYFDEMDNDMGQGILLGDMQIAEPDDFQKLQYVALELYTAINKNDQNLIEVTSAYIVNRNFKINEIGIEKNNDEFKLIIK